MALLDDVRASLYITSTVTDVVLQGLISAAIDDMRRVGVREELLDVDSMSPMATHAVIAYCHSFYNVDSIQSPFWLQSYNATVTALMNSDRSTYLYEEPDPEPEPEPEEPDGGGD